MTPRVRLTWKGKVSGVGGSLLMRREQAERILWLAHRGHWPHLWFRYEPHDEGPPMTALFALIVSSLKSGALAFAFAHWELFAAACAGLIFGVAVLFAPALDRPLLLAGPVLAMGLGILIGRKYFTASPTPTSKS